MYHEYVNARGEVARRHYNGRRVVTDDVIPFDSLSEQLFREASPDGRIWQMAAFSAIKDLKAVIGEDYREFAELTWPGASIEELTWRQICQMVDNAFFAARYRGVRDVAEPSKAAYLVEIELGTFEPSVTETTPLESIGC